ISDIGVVTFTKFRFGCVHFGSVFACLVTCSLLAGCRAQSVVLTDTACQPPCWQGITPGHSTQPEVVKILTSLSAVRTSSITVNKVGTDQNNVAARFNQSAAEVDVRVYFRDQVATATLFDARGAFTVSQILAIAGEPEYVYAEADCAETGWVTIVL